MDIVGIDEVGRGCWAGPLVAGAVILKEPIVGLKDSKLLSKNQRERFDAEIRSQALAVGLGWVEAAELDEIGLTEAVRLAMQIALSAIDVDYDGVVIDGNYNFLAGNPKSQCLIKADQTVPAVSAASVIAKVARDRRMVELAIQYPVYGFERHVGYGTLRHRQMLSQYGPSEIHRRSFRLGV